jgi:hypothetical protein
MWSAAVVVFSLFAITFVATTAAIVIITGEALVTNLLALFLVVLPALVLNGVAVNCMVFGDYCRAGGWVMVGFAGLLAIASSVLLAMELARQKKNKAEATEEAKQ